MRTRPILIAAAGLALAAALDRLRASDDSTATAPSSPPAGAGMIDGSDRLRRRAATPTSRSPS